MYCTWSLPLVCVGTYSWKVLMYVMMFIGWKCPWKIDTSLLISFSIVVLVADEIIAGIDELSFNFMYVHYIYFLEGCTVHVDCTHMYSSCTCMTCFLH